MYRSILFQSELSSFITLNLSHLIWYLIWYHHILQNKSLSAENIVTSSEHLLNIVSVEYDVHDIYHIFTGAHITNFVTLWHMEENYLQCNFEMLHNLNIIKLMFITDVPCKELTVEVHAIVHELYGVHVIYLFITHKFIHLHYWLWSVISERFQKLYAF